MRKALFILSVILFMFQCGFSQTNPLSGQLDATFGNAGELGDAAIFPFRYSTLSLVPGGEIVSASTNRDTISVLRFLPNGNRDISFGALNNGFSQTAIANFSGSVSSSVVQADRKTVVAGNNLNGGSISSGFLFRLNDSGTPDSSFGTNGLLSFNLFPQTGEAIQQVSQQLDGNLVITDVQQGSPGNDSVAFVRIKPNGSLDSSFGTNGIFILPFSAFVSSGPFLFSINLNGVISFAAYSNANGNDNLFLLQLNSNGTLNTSYGQNGMVLIDSTYLINGPNNLGLNFESNGQLLTVQSDLVGPYQLVMARYNTDGSMDENFGVNGMVNLVNPAGGTPYSIRNISATNDNLIIVAGLAVVGESMRTIIGCFNPDGSPSPAFGDFQGYTLLNCQNGDNIVYNLVIQPDDKILINGLVNEVGDRSFEIIRLENAVSSFSAINPMYAGYKMLVYPNPASDELHVLLPQNGELSLYDESGKIVLQRTVNAGSGTIGLNNLASGVYLVHYQSTEVSINSRLIKL